MNPADLSTFVVLAVGLLPRRCDRYRIGTYSDDHLKPEILIVGNEAQARSSVSLIAQELDVIKVGGV